MPISARIYLFVAIINDGDATYVLELTYHTCNHALRIGRIEKSFIKRLHARDAFKVLRQGMST